MTDKIALYKDNKLSEEYSMTYDDLIKEFAKSEFDGMSDNRVADINLFICSEEGLSSTYDNLEFGLFIHYFAGKEVLWTSTN